MLLSKLCRVFSAFGRRRQIVLSRQQIAKYSGGTEQEVSDIEEDLDYKGAVTWLQYIVNEEADKFLTNLSKEKLKEKQELEVLLELWRAEGEERVPATLSRSDWKVLIKDHSSIEEKLLYLKLVKRRQERFKARVETEKQLLRDTSQPGDDEDLNLIRKSVLMQKHLNQWNGIRSLKFGRPVVIDMDYELPEQQTFTTYQQIEIMYKFNCSHRQPCHLHFTSAHKNLLMKQMLQTNRNMLADFYEENLLEVFPKKCLFYLVPEGPAITEEELKEDRIYVLGGIAGPRERKRSLERAMSLKIPFGSIPLFNFVSLKQRSTIDLYLQVVLKILLDKFNGDSWKKVLDTHLPDRLYQKYPGLVGPVPDKRGRKSFKQFSKLYEVLKLNNKQHKNYL